MKTDRFENTIRQKLESISPDFHESDWDKMQNFMQVQNPPGLWQRYSSWIGYAAAASVTAVMAFMYVNQLSQNNNLVADVNNLKTQIEAIRDKPVDISKTDTVYIVQKGISSTASLAIQQNSPKTKPVFRPERTNSSTSDAVELTSKKSAGALGKSYSGTDRLYANRPILPEQSLKTSLAANSEPVQVEKVLNENQGGKYRDGFSVDNPTASAIVAGKALEGQLYDLALKSPVQIKKFNSGMNYALDNRLSPKQVRKSWMAATAASYKNSVSDKKTEQIAKTENVIPKFNLKVPYRFGVGIQGEKRAQLKTVTGEVLISKRFSLSSGVSWLKVKPVEFITEKIFRDKNHRDFKESHPDQVPRAFAVANIRIDPSLVQIPLTVAFRNELKNDWAYFVSAGTNVTLNSKEKISYDCMIPNPRNEFVSAKFERKLDVPLINSVNASAGIEKVWYPVVIQAETYLYSYFKPLTPLNQKTGPGFKVKVLYQIGKKM